MKTQKIFQYTGLLYVYKMLSKVTIIALILFMLTFLVIDLFRALASHQNYFGLIVSIVFLVVVSIPQPFLPNIEIDEKGLIIESFWKDLQLSWEEIVKVEEVEMPFNFKFWLVKTKKLTPFHRIYSMIYTNSFEPSFLIHPKLNGHENLIAKLMQFQRKAKKPQMGDAAVKNKTG